MQTRLRAYELGIGLSQTMQTGAKLFPDQGVHSPYMVMAGYIMAGQRSMQAQRGVMTCVSRLPQLDTTGQSVVEASQPLVPNVSLPLGPDPSAVTGVTASQSTPTSGSSDADANAGAANIQQPGSLMNDNSQLSNLQQDQGLPIAMSDIRDRVVEL